MNNAGFILSKSGELTASNNWAATNPGPVNAIGTLTPSGGTGRTYSYDANGNVLSDGVRTYRWDAENRLLSITEISSGHVSSFAYDGLGRRTAITESGGGTIGYLWCGSTLCSSYASGATQDRFLPWGEVDSGTEYYYERDHLGTVVSTTNTSGTTEGTLTTDAYGFTLSSSGTAATFGYAGMFSHSPSGLYLTKYRAYDPYSGRWLSRDPNGEATGINLYAYVLNDPVNYTDVRGLCSQTQATQNNKPCPSGPLNSIGQFFTTQGANVAHAGGVITPFGLIDPAAGFVGVGAIGVGTGMTAIGMGADILNGNYRSAFQAGLSTIIGSKEPGPFAFSPTDPADPGVEAITNYIFGPSSCP